MNAHAAQLALPLGAPAPVSSCRPLVFASGSNDPGEIRGMVSIGIAPGLAATRVGAASETELLRLAGTGVPVFLDSGAFSEVSADPVKQQRAGLVSRPGELLVVAPITDMEWRRRLDLYLRLARCLGPQLYAVAPDRVGCQDTTLERLGHYRASIRAVHDAGANVLLPLQRGARDLVLFYREASNVLGFAPVPAFPMKKAATSPAQLERTVRALRPAHVHVLGLGIKNRNTDTIVRRLQRASPATRISLDSNLITAAVGRGRGATRPLTAAQDDVRDEALPGVWGELSFPDWALRFDYTEAVASPSAWLGRAGLGRVAEEAGLSAEMTHVFLCDPDTFLQEPLHAEEPDGPARWEDPALALALDRAWRTFVERAVTAPRKEAAIRMAFASHPAAGQFEAGLGS